RVEGELALKRQRRADLTVSSPADGDFIVTRPADLVGRFIKKGEPVGYVVPLEAPVMLVVVSEEAADLVRERTKSIEVRLIDRLAGTLPATLAREVPSVTDKLPNLALSTIGGGEIVMDPRKPEEGKALSRMLQLELRFASQVYVTTLGGRT